MPPPRSFSRTDHSRRPAISPPPDKCDGNGGALRFRGNIDEDARMRTATALMVLGLFSPAALADGRLLPSVPESLPSYALTVRLDPARRKAVAVQTVTWTNTGCA